MSIYSCHNKSRPTKHGTYKAQSGWKIWQHTRKPIYVDIKTVFDLSRCDYTQQHASDPECLGCAHRAKEGG
ncbi:MAG: hypothetical protein ACXVCO_20095 [Ktedonobacterales bacterium]